MADLTIEKPPQIDRPDFDMWMQKFFVALQTSIYSVPAPLEATSGISLPDGTVSVPAIYFTSDTNSGFYRVGADEWAVVVGGSEVVRFKKSGSNIIFGFATEFDSVLAPYFQVDSRYSVPTVLVNNLFATGLADTSDISFRRINGTNASPTKMLTQEWCGHLHWWPYDGTGFNPGSFYGAAAGPTFYDDEAGGAGLGPYNFVVELNEDTPSDIAVFVADAAATTLTAAHLKTKTTHYTFTYDNGTNALALTFTAGNAPGVGNTVWVFKRVDFNVTAPFYGRQGCIKVIGSQEPSQTARGGVMTFEVCKDNQTASRPRMWIDGTTGNVVIASKAVHEGDTAGAGKYYPDRLNVGGSYKNGCPSGVCPIDYRGKGSLTIMAVDKAVDSAVAIREWNDQTAGHDITYDLTNHALILATVAADSKTERWQMTDDGNFIPITDKGVDIGDSTHRVDEVYAEYVSTVRDDSGISLLVKNVHATFATALISALATRAAHADYAFLKAYSSADGSPDLEFELKGDGNGSCDGSWTGSGAGYAEFIEWADGNIDNQDRVGYPVFISKGGKIAIAKDNYPGVSIIGVVTARPSAVGNAAALRWSKKYLKDEFGRYIFNEKQERILNPDFNSSDVYIPRDKRQEWACVSFIGQEFVRKGFPTGDRWIKIRDISKTVEEWLVR